MTWYDYAFLTFLTTTGCITYVAKEWLMRRDWLFIQDRARDAPGSTGHDRPAPTPDGPAWGIGTPGHVTVLPKGITMVPLPPARDTGTSWPADAQSLMGNYRAAQAHLDAIVREFPRDESGPLTLTLDQFRAYQAAHSRAVACRDDITDARRARPMRRIDTGMPPIHDAHEAPTWNRHLEDQ